MGKHKNNQNNEHFRPKKVSVFDIPRPTFPKRAVVTGGMPYGNKKLHFGHVGGVFVQADCLSRFLRDRIGDENVIFVSGTDCYGSPIVESYRKLKESGEFDGTIEDFVRTNHDSQKDTLDKYDISLNLYAASGLDEAKCVHENMTNELMNTWYENGYLEKLVTSQFYDTKAQQFLNGRQVVGRCPVDKCQSDKAYADECALGHQYMPSDLINPKSTISGETPEMRDVTNWYIDITKFSELMNKYADALPEKGNSRPLVYNTIKEFLLPPTVYIKKDFLEDFNTIKDNLPQFIIEDDEKKTSFSVIFNNLDDRDRAKDLLNENNIRFRAGKTLVPFRLTGNIDWGVPAPVLDGETGLTIWVWPESLWAPISFTKTYLNSIGKPDDEWEKYWLSTDSEVFQFIGQDNIYFYGIAETAMFMALQGKENLTSAPKDGQMTLPTLVANNHILFLNKKASSSGNVKPPMAEELLEYYTAEQLRAHFLGLGLSLKSVSFQPKPLNPATGEKDADPVEREGKMLSNVFNRVARSCFYTIQKHGEPIMPLGNVSDEVLHYAKETILKYEHAMYKFEFHTIMNLMDTYIRDANKFWAKNIKDNEEDTAKRNQVIIDTLHMVKTAMVLMHPIAPKGTELLCEYLGFGKEVFSWDNIFKTFAEIAAENGESDHEIKELPPRFDFFPMKTFE